MAVKVRIPTPLRSVTNGLETVELQPGSVDDALRQLTGRFDGLEKRLFKTPGELNRFINVYVNNEDIRFLDNLGTPLNDGDELSIVPAIAGG